MVLRTFIALLLTMYIVSCQKESEKLPDFNIRKTDQTEVNVTQYIEGKTSIVIHFDADCKGCQDEAQTIVNHLDELGDVKVVFVSTQDFERIDVFDKYFKLSEKPNILIGQDYTDAMQSNFKVYSTPLIALSNRKGRLRKVIVGEIGGEKLLEFINEIN